MQSSHFANAKDLINKETENCVNQALRKGNIQIIDLAVESSKENAIALQKTKVQEKELNEIKANLVKYCETLKKCYETDFKQIIESEDCKHVIEFFKSEGLPQKAIHILLSEGIVTMKIVHQLAKEEGFRKSTKDALQNPQWSEIFEEALRDSKSQDFAKEKKQDEAVCQEKLDEREKRIAEALKGVEELREKTLKLNKEAELKNTKEIEASLEEVNAKLAKMNMTLNLPSINQIKDLTSQLNTQMSILDGIKQDLQKKPEDLPASELIERNGILKGFLFGPYGSVKEKEPVVTFTSDILQNEKRLASFIYTKNEFEMKYEIFDAAHKFEKAKAWTKMGGSNWAASLGASISGLSASFSTSAQHAQGSSTEESGQEASGKTTLSHHETRHIYAAKKKISIPRDKLRLSDSALKALQKISMAEEKEKKAAEEEKKALVEEFFSVYGSHVLASVVLGGFYDIQASADEVTTENQKETQKAASEKLQTEVAAAFKYSAYAVSGAYSQQQTSSEGKKESEKTEDKSSQIRFSTSVKGGLSNASFPQWTSSLEFNSSWEVIDRELEKVIPIWKLLEQHEKELPEIQISSLAEILETGWKEQFEKAKPKPKPAPAAKGKVFTRNGAETNLKLNTYYYFRCNQNSNVMTLDQSNFRNSPKENNGNNQLWAFLPSSEKNKYFIVAQKSPFLLLQHGNASIIPVKITSDLDKWDTWCLDKSSFGNGFSITPGFSEQFGINGDFLIDRLNQQGMIFTRSSWRFDEE